jgi:hypothetical protein
VSLWFEARHLQIHPNQHAGTIVNDLRRWVET